MPRDLTRAQFTAALKRNGFRNAFMGLWFADTTGAVSEGTHYGAVIHQQRSGLDRRSTLAHLIRSRARDVKRQAAEKTRACETVGK